MRKCPYCAEDIQEAAIKCKHCGEDTRTELHQNSGQSKAKRSISLVAYFFAVVGALPFFWMTKVGYDAGETSVAITTAGLGVGFFFSALLAWLIGDAFRKFSHPDVILSNGSIDMASQKLFWMFGPQLVCVWLAFLGMFILTPELKTQKPVLELAAMQENPAPGVQRAPQESASVGVESSPQGTDTISQSESVASVSLQVVPAVTEEKLEIVTAEPPQKITAPSEILFAPSFDCGKSSTKVEHLICSNRELAAIDIRLMQSFKTALISSMDIAKLKRAQNIWRKNERDVCSDVECVFSAYQKRLSELAQ
ncbi:MAG: hypothetical protein Q7T21_06580 [Gallionella sp.]|nr:hypothetical protein [Gallionella sp.]